ncbi:MAG: hypothetical protein NTZ53_01465 [Cyanobacteria bacterium]|nr:hypothetical protein [Cyanobacteriota bacterium]
MALVTGLGLAWAASPNVPVKVQGAAVFLTPGSRIGLYARSPGQIQRLPVRIGQAVAQGELIASIDRIDQAAPGGGWSAANPDALRRQSVALEQQIGALRSQIATLRTSNGPIGKQLSALDDLRREEVVARYSPLWVGAQDLYLRNASQIKALEGQIAQLKVSQAELQAQGASQLVLAPQPGRLLSLAVTLGQAVVPGQRLGTLALAARPVGPGAAGLAASEGAGNRSKPNGQALGEGKEGERDLVALFTSADASQLRVGAEIEIEPQLQSRNQYGGSNQRYGFVPGRIVSLSPTALDLAALTAVVGDADLASSLMARTRQEAFGAGGDPLENLGNQATAPLVLVGVAAERAATASGLRWSSGLGPPYRLENGTPAAANVTVERRPLLSFVLPFLRWLGGKA